VAFVRNPEQGQPNTTCQYEMRHAGYVMIISSMYWGCLYGQINPSKGVVDLIWIDVSE
jgi:hypothetical protein